MDLLDNFPVSFVFYMIQDIASKGCHISSYYNMLDKSSYLFNDNQVIYIRDLIFSGILEIFFLLLNKNNYNGIKYRGYGYLLPLCAIDVYVTHLALKLSGLNSFQEH
jgi:hypothetical protein